MASQDDVKARAAAVKADADKLHSATKYDLAYAEYTKAIEIDDKDAVLYVDRAVSSSKMKKYTTSTSATPIYPCSILVCVQVPRRGA